MTRKRPRLTYEERVVLLIAAQHALECHATPHPGTLKYDQSQTLRRALDKLYDQIGPR